LPSPIFSGKANLLEAQERLLGPEHPETLISVNNLAVLLADKGDYAAAQLLYERTYGLPCQEKS
jgi:Tetratricopeptide repeat